jgi:Flagellar hook-length control protein FliK
MSTAPVSPNIQPITKNTLEIPRTAATLAGIDIGETLSATILEKISANNYLLALKNIQIPATSAIPFSAGEKIIVKVSSLQPQMVLNIVDGKVQAGDDKVNEILLQWRSNPESLLQVIGKVAQFTQLVQEGSMPSMISPAEIDKLIKLFDSIIFSSQTKDNSLFLKEFVAKTGLLLESTLRQIVTEAGKGFIDKPIEDNLKTLLLKLSSSIQEVLKDISKLDSSVTSKLINLASFSNEALQSIEEKQILNTVFQKSDNGLVLQVPIALGEGFRMADIFIRPENKKREGKEKFSSSSVVVFLDMDFLGKLAINASIREGNFSCMIKCEDEDVKTLINNDLDKLKNALLAIGYRVDYIDCMQENGLTQVREEFLQEQSFFAAGLLNFFV